MEKQQSPYNEEEEKNQILANRYHSEIFQTGKLEVADEILLPDFVLHNPVLTEAVLCSVPKLLSSSFDITGGDRADPSTDVLMSGQKG